jgi:adenosine deaminase
MWKVSWVLICIVLLACADRTAAQTLRDSPLGHEQRASAYLESIRRQPPLLLAFLRELPKGGDLHNHLAGAIYAESLIDFASQDGLCVDRTTSFLIAPPCDASCDRFAIKPGVSCAYQDHVLYNSIVDAWSMRNWNHGEASGHDHFFATFDKFFLATLNHTADSIAEAASRAAADHLQYLELMHTADGMQSAELGRDVGWNDDFATMRKDLLAAGLRNVAATTSKTLAEDESRMRAKLECGRPTAAPGCAVEVRYLYQVLRGLPKERVFAQILLGFELASSDPHFVGLNLVMPEDWYVPMHDFDLHMKMIDYLHGVYPRVHVSLHAGEIAMGLVPPEGLRFHIRESIERGHAERIGHGVDVMHEDRAVELLKRMAERKVLVEICLTSNDSILGVSGDEHPFAAYRRYGVPVALATDDEGVSRSDMSHEYLRAVESYRLSYSDLKDMARQSLEHSFLPGASLWGEAKGFRRSAPCAKDDPEAREVSSGCERFLETSERAKVQWKLEREFANFEKKY